MSFRRYTLQGVALCTLVVCLGRGLWAARPESMPESAPLPQDLRLDNREVEHVEALSHFAWGLFLQMQSEAGFEAAAEQYVLSLRHAPDSAVVLDYLVTPYRMQKQHKLLLEKLMPLVREHPASPRLAIMTSEVLNALGRRGEAIKLLHECLEAGNWQEPTVLRELFVLLWGEKRYADIEKLLAEARHHPGMKDRFVLEQAAAIFYHALGSQEPKSSKRGKRRVKALDRESLRHARRAATLYAQADRVADIKTLAALFMELDRVSEGVALLAKVRESKRFASPDLLLLECRGLEDLGRNREAAALVDTLRDGTDLPPRFLPEIARMYTGVGRYADAIEVLEEALVKFPGAVSLRLQLALLYLRTRHPKLGLATLFPVKMLPPEGLQLMAHLYYQMGDAEKALAVLKQAERAAKEAGKAEFFRVDFYLFFATLCEETGDAKAGIEQARKALALDPDDPSACNFLGYVLADHNCNLSEAETLVQKALAADPDNEAYLDSLAWVRYRQGKFAEAHAIMCKTVRLGCAQLDGVILDHAGDIAAALDLEVLARWYWEEALRKGVPDAKAIRRKLGLPAKT